MISLLQQFYNRGSSPPPPPPPINNSGGSFRKFNPCDPCCTSGVSTDPTTFCDITPPDDLVLINGSGKHVLAYQGLDVDGNAYWRGLVSFENAISFIYTHSKVTGTRYSYDNSNGEPNTCNVFANNLLFSLGGFTTQSGSLLVFSDKQDYSAYATANTWSLFDTFIPGSFGCYTLTTNYGLCLEDKVHLYNITIPSVYVQITRKPAIPSGYIYEEKIKTQYDSDYEYIKWPRPGQSDYVTYKNTTELCNPISIDGLFRFGDPIFTGGRNTYLNQNMSNFPSALYSYDDLPFSDYSISGNFNSVKCNLQGIYKYNSIPGFGNDPHWSDNCWWSRSFPVFDSIGGHPEYGSTTCLSFLGWSDDTIGKDVFTYSSNFFNNYTPLAGPKFTYTVTHPQFHVDNTLEESSSLHYYTNRQKYGQTSDIWANGFFRVIIPNNTKRTINPVNFINTRTRQLARNFNCQINGFNFELNCIKITTTSSLSHVALYVGQPDNKHFGALLIDDANGDYNFYFVELLDNVGKYLKQQAMYSSTLDKEISTWFPAGCPQVIGATVNYSNYIATTCDPRKTNDFGEDIINWDRKVYKTEGNLITDGVLNIDPLVLGFDAQNHYKTIVTAADSNQILQVFYDCGNTLHVPALPFNVHVFQRLNDITEVYETAGVIITELN